jgi:AraC-like DNA-binding protein
VTNSFTFPATLALPVLELLRDRGLAPERLLSSLHLVEERLIEPGARLGVDIVEQLVVGARALSNEPGLGLLLGQRARVTSFGYVGFAALSAPSLGHAVQLATRFTALSPTPVRLRLNLEAEVASLVLEERADLGGAREIVLLAFAVGLCRLGSTLVDRELMCDLDLSFSEPDYFAPLSHEHPNVRFEQPLTQLIFRRSILEYPIAHADPAAHCLAREQCARLLGDSTDGASLVDRVRSLLAMPGGGFRSLNDVSSAMALSPRSLKRKLAACDLSFSVLIEQQRRETSMILLRHSQLTIGQIAHQLEYSSVSNFVRAFRRWTGETPAAFRRSEVSRPVRDERDGRAAEARRRPRERPRDEAER